MLRNLQPLWLIEATKYNVLPMDDRTGERLDPDLAGRPESIPSGPHQVRAEFAYDGGGLAKGGDVTLYYDGAPAGKGRVEATPPMVFSADETTDIGYESGTPVSPGHTTHSSRFTGKIGWVQIDLGDEDNDHFIDPEERLGIAMARQ